MEKKLKRIKQAPQQRTSCMSMKWSLISITCVSMKCICKNSYRYFFCFTVQNNFVLQTSHNPMSKMHLAKHVSRRRRNIHHHHCLAGKMRRKTTKSAGKARELEVSGFHFSSTNRQKQSRQAMQGGTRSIRDFWRCFREWLEWLFANTASEYRLWLSPPWRRVGGQAAMLIPIPVAAHPLYQKFIEPIIKL